MQRRSSARRGLRAAGESATAAPATPVVTIDNLSDPLATIVEVSLGDLLGELLDTVRCPPEHARRALARHWAQAAARGEGSAGRGSELAPQR